MDNNSACSTKTGKKPCIKSCLISVVAVTVFLCIYSFVVHQILLKADYEATPNLWRSKEDMDALGMWWPVYHLLLAMVVTCLFKKFRGCKCGPECKCAAASNTRCPIKSGGLCFGIKLGLIMGLGMGCGYLYMPIPFDLAMKWFFSGLFEGIGIGCILGMICKSNSCGTNTCETKAP